MMHPQINVRFQKLYKEPQTHEMENSSGDYEIMQTAHQLLDTRIPVIPMAIQDVDIVRAQSFERGIDSYVLGLSTVAGEMDLL